MSDTQLKVTEATTGTNLGAITATDLTGAAVKIGKQHMVDDSGASYSASNRLPVDLPSGGATAANQLPNNHQVTVSNQLTQPLTDAQLRASAVPVSASALPLPSGAATAANQLPNNHQVTVSNQVAQPLTDAQLRAANVPVVQSSADKLLSGQTTAATGATITLPAPAAGQFHHISAIELILYTSATRTGSATPVSVTSTNLNGFRRLFATAAAIGTVVQYELSTVVPMHSQVAATASTIVLPAVTGGIWAYNVIYREGV